jgi:hypothetical protein
MTLKRMKGQSVTVQRMKTSLAASIAIGALVLIVSAASAAQQGAASPSKPSDANHDAAHYAFRDTVDQVTTKDPSVPRFKLSAQYPTVYPGPCGKDVCTWLARKADFTAHFPKKGLTQKEKEEPRNQELHAPDWHADHWDEYVQSILDYVKQGQDDNLADNVGFRTQVGGKTRWFNVPWMAYDPTAGREFVHGTTNERTAHVAELAPGNDRPLAKNTTAAVGAKPHHNATPEFRGTGMLAELVNMDCEREFPYGFETWSVGYYNEWGGYAIGKAFPRTGQPHLIDFMGSKLPDGLPFPEGTVVVKVLTTNAPTRCVKVLEGAPEWHVNRHKLAADGYDCEREVQTSRVLQVDVAVTDRRSPTHWVYSTFAYDGQSTGKTFWDRLVPLGVQWGADPWTFPAVTVNTSLPLQQTVLNPESHSIVQHYGCQDRLAGPVDNPQSSCVSCHGSAYAAPNGAPSTMATNVPPSFGFDGMCIQFSLDNASYFQNQQPPQHFPGGRFPDAISLDTSLQMEVAFDQYGRFHTDHAPLACTDPNQIVPHGPGTGQ